MKIEYHKVWSESLGRDMEMKSYGHAGKPLLVFPSGCGRFYEFEDFGMVNAVADFLESGKLQLYTVDSVDCESWLAHEKYPGDRGWRHEQYDQYIVREALLFIREHSRWPGKLMTTGCSMGGYHAANFFFRHPDVFDVVIALSGLYGPRYFVGDYVDDHVYFNFPLLYLPELTDFAYLEQYRASHIIVCTGQGAWEEDCISEMRALEAILKQLDVPAWFDYWGRDVNHDWPWWQRQLPYFLETLNL
ncbi:MAG: esterase family protein [Anaerolineae bacterium]|nr:esterase family protein [Anaerolineae bacterium]